MYGIIEYHNLLVYLLETGVRFQCGKRFVRLLFFSPATDVLFFAGTGFRPIYCGEYRPAGDFCVVFLLFVPENRRNPEIGDGLL